MSTTTTRLGGLGRGVLRLIGSKHRIAEWIVGHLQTAAAGRACLVEVFGGSAAVMLTAGERFDKRVWNDLDGDLVNFFRVLSDPVLSEQLAARLKRLPPARAIFEADHRVWLQGGLSFKLLTDPVERARATFYRNAYCYGGKMRNGGFVVSLNDRTGIKEFRRYCRVVGMFDAFTAFFQATVIESLPYAECISLYGKLRHTVLYVDPPYVDCEHYYAAPFCAADHVFLAHQLAAVPAPVVVSYYDHPRVRELYPEPVWQWHTKTTVKNCQNANPTKAACTEVLLVKPATKEVVA